MIFSITFKLVLISTVVKSISYKCCHIVIVTHCKQPSTRYNVEL